MSENDICELNSFGYQLNQRTAEQEFKLYFFFGLYRPIMLFNALLFVFLFPSVLIQQFRF